LIRTEIDGNGVGVGVTDKHGLFPPFATIKASKYSNSIQFNCSTMATTTTTTPNEDDEINDEDAFCSVLNVVINHTMQDPSPMEPREFQRQDTIQVPVVRVFGPVLRSSSSISHGSTSISTNTSKSPCQSACLYIHGAFPYLLARPVIAGPDGSLRRALPASGQVDWDDPASVEGVVATIATALETSLQSLDLYGRGDDNNKASHTSPNNPKTKKDATAPIIRQVTVVEGRGFYTYCPGPPAPFLRVEYYNPKLRWKVKLMLERGLELPLSYHPDPTYYDRPPEPPGDALKFHCYEAHIPYTMQFFKDWNLAGMSYIHLKRGKIRGPMAETVHTVKYGGNANDTDAAFLRSNTPDRFTWGEPKPRKQQQQQDREEVVTAPPLQQSSSQESSRRVPDDLNYQPPKKETSCDVEMDCTMQDLLNVESVLTSLPSNQDESDKIQWRAVPSLQEIWRQERRRMAKLLTKDQDFLSHPSTPSTSTSAKQPSFTLNVKKDAARSGARLAAKGMQSLVGVTTGLPEDFARSLQQIMERHKRAVDEIDQQLMQQDRRQEKPNQLSKQFLDLTPTIHEAMEALGSLNAPESKAVDPTWNEAIGALGSLAATEGTQNNSTLVEGDLEADPTMNEAIDVLGSLAAAGATELSKAMEKDAGDSSGFFELSATQTSQHSQGNISLSYSCSQEIHESAQLTMDPLQYSQRVERGDGVGDGPGCELEDYIDPETLRPYENLDFGDDRCRAKFVVETDPPGMIRVCGCGWPGCPREGHDDAERVKAGYYKTVTTGAYVDGVVDTSQADYDDDEDDNEKFERVLSALATQIPTRGNSSEATPPTQNYRSAGGFTQSQYTNLAQEMATEPSDQINSNQFDSTFEPSEDESDEGGYPDAALAERPAATGCASEMETAVTSNVNPPSSYPAYITPTASAPSRAQISTLNHDNRLHFVESGGSTPSWLLHAARYMASKETNRSGGSKSLSSRLSGVCSMDAYVQPVLVPPTRSKVVAWCKKRARQSSAPNKQPAKRKKADEPNCEGIQCKGHNQSLEIDSNSRKIVTKIEKVKPAEAGETSVREKNVEEVQWYASQSWQLTMSQHTSQNESEQVMRVDPGPETPSVPANTQADHPLTNNSAPTGRRGEKGSAESDSLTHSASQSSDHPLDGIGAQGGRIHIQGGGGLKAKTRPSQGVGPTPEKKVNGLASNSISSGFLPSPISFMSIEIHVQCRTGASRLDSKKISMAPDSNKDRICAVVFVYGIDPGGGESLDVLARGCIFVPFETEQLEREVQVGLIRTSMPRATMGVKAPLSVECVKDEKSLLLRLASIVRMKDPDMLLSWDTQCAGLGYIIERGVILGNDGKAGVASNVETSNDAAGIDMVRLLGRTPHDKSASPFLVKAPVEKITEAPVDQGANVTDENKWRGSGLGSDWDERVGAGAAAASIVSELSSRPSIVCLISHICPCYYLSQRLGVWSFLAGK
jgi:hypothetical protein